MSLFRRDKDSDNMEEFRRVRQALGQPPSVPTTVSPPSAPELALPQENMTPITVVGPINATPVAPSQEDLLQKYRQGATTVAKDSSFKGALKSDSNLCIEGNFDGELEARAIIFIAPGANVKAEVIRASDVIVAGTLNGTVDASGRFHAMPSAQVSGEINSRILVVDQGSQVNCRFVMKARGGK